MQDKENAAISKNDLIAKLEGISRLYKEAEARKAEAERFQPAVDCRDSISSPVFPGEYKDDAERKEWEYAVLHDSHNATEQMEKYYIKHRRPYYKAPVYKDPVPTTEKNRMDLLNKLRLGAVAVAVLLVGSSFSVDGGISSVLDIVLLPLIVCAALFVFAHFKIRGASKESKSNIAEAKAAHAQAVAAAEAEHAKKMEEFEEAKEAFMKAYAQWREDCRVYASKRSSLQAQWESERKDGEQKLLSELYVPVLKKLEAANDLISENYLPALDDIIDLLRTNRADSLKEAINLYEEISIRERQLKLQQEQIEQKDRDTQRQCYSCEYQFQCEVKFRPNCASYVPQR